MTLWNADRNDCAPVALATIAAHHGIELDLAEARKMCGTTAQGTSLLSLHEAAKRLGFVVKGARVAEDKDALSSGDAWATLRRCNFPLIAHVLVRPQPGEKRLPPWEKEGPLLDAPIEQFVVVERAGATHLTLVETGVGPRELSKDEFLAMWTGNLLLLGR